MNFYGGVHLCGWNNSPGFLKARMFCVVSGELALLLQARPYQEFTEVKHDPTTCSPMRSPCSQGLQIQFSSIVTSDAASPGLFFLSSATQSCLSIATVSNCRMVSKKHLSN